MPRWDIEWKDGEPKAVPHFCRVNGCFGKSHTHGYTFEHIKQIILKHYKRPVIYWESIDEQRYLANF